MHAYYDYHQHYDFNVDNDIDVMFGDNRPDMLARVETRFDPLEIPEVEFKQRFRFSKESIEERLVPLLYPNGMRAQNGRGFPFTPTQVNKDFKRSNTSLVVS